LLFWTYIIFIAIHVTLSSIAVLLFPGSGILRVHFGSMVVSLILLVTGFVVYGKLLQLQLMDAYEMRTRTDTAICAATCPNSNRLCSFTDWSKRSAVPVRHCELVPPYGGTNLLASSPPRDGLAAASCALTFCKPAVSASICFCWRAIISCWSRMLRCALRNSLSNIAFTASYRTAWSLPSRSRLTRSGPTFSTCG